MVEITNYGVLRPPIMIKKKNRGLYYDQRALPREAGNHNRGGYFEPPHYDRSRRNNKNPQGNQFGSLRDGSRVLLNAPSVMKNFFRICRSCRDQQTQHYDCCGAETGEGRERGYRWEERWRERGEGRDERAEGKSGNHNKTPDNHNRGQVDIMINADFIMIGRNSGTWSSPPKLQSGRGAGLKQNCHRIMIRL